MAKIKGLGRGLDALLGSDITTAAPAVSSGDSLGEIAIDALQPGKYQPRMHMNDEALRELADSIKAQGLMQPILVRPVGGGKHEIIAGERRWRAARIAGLTKIPVQIRAVPDNTAAAMALIENIQREDLNPLEEATGIQRLISEFGMTHETAAIAVGRSRTAVSNLLRLLALSEPAQKLLQDGQLDMGHARALLALSGMKQIETARMVAARELSVRETEKLVAAQLKGARTTSAANPTKDRDVLRLQEELSQKLGTKVTIKAKRGGRGTLQIDYSNLVQLDGLLQRIK